MLTKEVEAILSQYRLEHDLTCEADVIVALLRVNTASALAAAAAMLGRPITKCPPGIPPWPPKPASRAPRGRRLSAVQANPCLPTTGAFQRYRQLRVGRRAEDLASRGVTPRDLRRWEKLGYIQWEG